MQLAKNYHPSVLTFQLQVYAEATVGYYGKCHTVADMKTIDITLSLSGLNLKCPSVVEAWADFECTMQVATGMNLDMELKTPFGDIYNGTMEGKLYL